MAEWACDPTTNSNVEEAADYLRQILQKSDKEAITMLITYSRGYGAVSRLCSRFPHRKFISIMIDPVNPLAPKSDNRLPENVIANIVFVASDVMRQLLIYHLYIYKLFNVEWIDRAKIVHLPANHAEIGRRKAYIGYSINDDGKIHDCFTKENDSIKGQRLGDFFRLFFDATYYRAQGKIDRETEAKLMQATQLLQNEFGNCHGDNLFANGKRIVTETEQLSVPAVKSILAMITKNVAKANQQKTIWSFFSQKKPQQSEEIAPKFLRAML